ncbi:beta-1,3-galactosyltransferase 5-like [Daktulosphaira vitifoliae]|uniref:beta-1,3-galactosyltransferase 5-like n=1 Tax=Daktulosphaira vitifoliae TaxID=58002 RepID=UPI0021AA8758|nr:beta-1,3-galactosyltransferase 5-like [Daktulosphaira vitifoliae]
MEFRKNEVIVLLLLFISTFSFCVLFNYTSTLEETKIVHPKPSVDHLLNLYNFRYTINNNACNSLRPILVHSHVEHFKIRSILRIAYPQSILEKLGFQYIFMVGTPRSSEVQSQVILENSKFGDIVQGNFYEAYRNLTYKHIMALKWFHEYCSHSTYMIKIDDDIAVNLFKLNDIMKSKYQLAGYIVKSKPIRDFNNKWYISKQEFKSDYYPTFLSGWLYIASRGTVAQLLRAIIPEKYFWIDDLFVTGFLAERAKIQKTDLSQEFETDPGPIYCCIKKKQRCDFLAAPTGENKNLLKEYPKQLIECKYKNKYCNYFQKSKFHHTCLDMWKINKDNRGRGIPKIEILH